MGVAPTSAGMVVGPEDDAHVLIAQLEAERDRLRNAVGKLRESNAILKTELDKEFDRDYKTAIEENIPLIASYTARIERFEQEIASLKRGVQVLQEGEALLAAEAAQEQNGRSDQNGAMEL